MKRCIAIIGGIVLLLGGAVPAGAAIYGPGGHWVDTVNQGTYGLDIDGQFTVNIPGLGPLSFDVTGQMTVWHDDALDTLDPLDPGHLNHVDVELVSMSLTGDIPMVGSILLTCGDEVGNGLNDGPLYTPGAITELEGDSSLASSSFDIFFTVNIQSPAYGNITVFNKDPLPVESVIDRIPPVNFEYAYAGGLLVYDVLDPDGTPVATIPAAVFTPEPATLVLLGGGALGLIARHRRRKL